MADNRRGGWDEDERPTNRGGSSHTGTDYHVGRLMAESVNFRRRLEVVEARLYDLETASQDSVSPKSRSEYPSKRVRLFALVKTTITYTIIGITAIIAALKESGYLK